MITIFDVLSFIDKPDLLASNDMSFIYEWEATLRDEGQQTSDYSAFTIEEKFLIEVVQLRNNFKYIVVDIESLKDYHDPIAMLYVKIAKAAAPNSKVSWWNTSPALADNIDNNPINREKWSALFHMRKGLVETNDFCVMAAYFKSGQSLDAWKVKHLPRITEARKLYGSKPIFVALSPHTFNTKEKPWPHVPGDLIGGAMDALAEIQVEGIVLWSFEGTNGRQLWDENWPWVSAVRSRISVNGAYIAPLTDP